MLETFFTATYFVVSIVFLVWMVIGEYTSKHSRKHALFIAGGMLLMVGISALSFIVTVSFVNIFCAIIWFNAAIIWFATAKNRKV